VRDAALAWTIPWEHDGVTAAAFAGASRRLVAGNRLGKILVWDLPEKASDPLPPPVRLLEGHTNEVTSIASLADGRRLISTSYDHTVRLWDLEAAATRKETLVLDPRTREAASKKGKPIAEPGPTVEVAAAARVLDAHEEWVRGLSLAGGRFLTGDDAGRAILWDAAEMKELRRLQVPGWLRAVALSPDAKRAATCEYAPRYAGFANAIRLWDLETGTSVLDLGASLKKDNRVVGVVAAAFSPDGATLALGQGGEVEGGKGKIHLLEAATGKKLQEFAGHEYGVTGLAFPPDGKQLATCGRDTVVRLWSLADGKMLKELGKPRGGQFKDWIHAVAISADGAWLAAPDMAGQVNVWSLA
jgi:WD40 repeat protein